MGRRNHCPGCRCEETVKVTAKAISYQDDQFWKRADILKKVFHLKGDRINKNHHGWIPKSRLPALINQMSNWYEWRLYVESDRYVR